MRTEIESELAEMKAELVTLNDPAVGLAAWRASRERRNELEDGIREREEALVRVAAEEERARRAALEEEIAGAMVLMNAPDEGEDAFVEACVAAHRAMRAGLRARHDHARARWDAARKVTRAGVRLHGANYAGPIVADGPWAVIRRVREAIARDWAAEGRGENESNALRLVMRDEIFSPTLPGAVEHGVWLTRIQNPAPDAVRTEDVDVDVPRPIPTHGIEPVRVPIATTPMVGINGSRIIEEVAP